jgi:hypothetical protein
MSDKVEPPPETFPIKLNFRIPPNTPSVYATHMFIHPGPNEVVLAFYEIVHPVLTEVLSGERLKVFQESGVDAWNVARVTISKAAFPEFAKAMQSIFKQVETLEEKKQDAEATRDNPES